MEWTGEIVNFGAPLRVFDIKRAADMYAITHRHGFHDLTVPHG